MEKSNENSNESRMTLQSIAEKWKSLDYSLWVEELRDLISWFFFFWVEIDFEAKRVEWESKATEIADVKESFLQSRKNLTEQTKKFKAAPDEEKLKTFNALLKLYQEEIDRLTRRSKLAENTFLGMFQLLADAPDPNIAFAAALVILF